MVSLFPKRCPICGSVEPTLTLCSHCRQSLNRDILHRYRLDYVEELHIAFEYGKVGKELIWDFKFSQKTALVEVIGDLLCEKILEEKLHHRYSFLTYVPMTKRAEGKRGFNQSQLLCEYISQGLDIPMVTAFRKIKETREQLGLDHRQRKVNLIDAFECINAPPSLIIVDDVITTGATIGELAGCSRKMGIKKVAALIAATHNPL